MAARVTGVMAKPCTAVIDTQLAVTGEYTIVIEQGVVPTTPTESVT